MRNTLFLLVALLLSQPVWSQSNELTLSDAILKQRSTLSPESINQLKWIPGTTNFAYVNSVDEEATLFSGKAESNQRTVLTTLSKVNAALEKAELEPRTSFPRYQFVDAESFRFLYKNKVIQFFIGDGSMKILNGYNKGARNLDLHKGHNLAYTNAQNLHVSLPGQTDEAVTTESNENIRNGEATHRYEFGIGQGTFWSPSGKKLAFYRTDETMVTFYPLLKLKEQPAGYEVISYPFAGEPSHHVTLGVYDVNNGKTVFLQTDGDPEHYLTNITWTPDEKEILIAELNRDQNFFEINRYDAKTGKKLGQIFEEKHDKYVQPLHQPVFLPGSNKEFIWQSERDGFNHLHHYKMDGTYLGQLTSGKWMVTSFLGFDAKGKHAFVEGTGNEGLERHIYKVNLKKKSVQNLTEKEPGTHRAKLSKNGAYFIDSYSSVKTPRNIAVRSTKDGKSVQTLLTASNPLADLNLGETKLFQIKAADGQTNLWCRMITPAGYSDQKKYPAIVYVYNGPGVQLVQDRWLAGAPLWMHYAAQQGYVIFSIDGRGSANRGRDFEQATFRQLGTIEMDDQLEGFEYLKGLSYVDGDRIGIHGWSYGGFMTTSLMTRKPGFFKVGVGGGPVIDWSMYEVMYTERFMDTPETNPEGYENSNLMNYADQLEGKLLLIHGTSDDIVVWQNSLAYLEKCIDVGTQLDYFVYPNHPHNVRGKDRVHLMTKVLNYLMDNL